MNTVISGIDVSPVNMEDRKNLGLRAGDTVKVHLKIEDKGKIRTQVFEGIVLARKHGSEPGATFTVRKVVDGIGVEKIFPLYSPNIDRIEIVRRSTVRRAKIYYIREKVAREIRRQMRRMRLVNVSSESDIEAKAAADAKGDESATQSDKPDSKEGKTEDSPKIEEVKEDPVETETPEEETAPAKEEEVKEEKKEAKEEVKEGEAKEEEKKE